MRENIYDAGAGMPSIKLVDITTVSVNKDLPQSERCAEYKRQLKTPSRYICGGFTVKAVHLNNGNSLEDCLRGMMA